MILLSLLAASVALAGQPAAFQGTPTGFGLGAVAGDPTGLAAAWRKEDGWYLQGAIGYSVLRSWMHLNVDYIVPIVTLDAPELPGVSFPIYVGVGGRARLGDRSENDDKDEKRDGYEPGLGVRVPVGISVLPHETRIDAYLELVPVVTILPDTEGDLDAGIGARFYF